MFSKILIANRGEIAVRIIRACKEMGIKTVAVYSKADADCMHVSAADQAVCIGQAQPSQSYLMTERIISVAEICDVDAIHPGYGFLSENARFAQICQDCNITFIGPRPEAIRAMGDKAVARETMRKAGVPTTPGSNGIINTEAEAMAVAHKLKYPVIIKASAGGGGRGMRIAHNDASLIQGFHAARTEAEKAFGNNEIYIEKYIVNPKHIEFQILGDNYGNIVHLGERDCSIQRRNQKLIEESPSPVMTPELRKKMGEAAVKAAKAVNYSNAGTIEFLLTGDNSFYFMEMNTRIHVEHPVTESVYHADLIRQQILVASGERAEVPSSTPSGHSIEFRINAEDPDAGFRPSPGKIQSLHFPGGYGVRVDSHIYQGYTIPPYYDSLIAKLIVWGTTRQHAIERGKRALEEFAVEGIKTTVPFHQRVLEDKRFVSGNFDTSFIEKMEAVK